MKDKYLNIRIESDLKDQVIRLAKEERRTISDQTVYLIERGLHSLHRQFASDNRYPVQEVDNGKMAIR